MRHSCALLVYDFRASGVVRNVLRIAAAARDAELEVSLWPIRLQGDMLGEVPSGIPIHPILEGPSRLRRGIDSLRAVPALVRALDRREPRVLLSGGNHTHLPAAIAMLFARDRTAIRFIGRASNAVISGGSGWAPWRKLVDPFERFQFASMDRIAAVSGELANAIGTRLQIDCRRLTTIPNGVDLAGIAVATLAPVYHPFLAGDGPPVILGMGRISRQKDFEMLVRAFAIVRKVRPARLLILGSGDKGRIDRLHGLAARLGVGADVDFPGFVQNPAPYLRRASLFALSSRWEGASNVLLEALACGCPIVATRAETGVAEVLLNGRIAPLVPVGDEHAFAEAILARLAQPRDSEALRARAAQFDLSCTLAAYVQLLGGGCR